MIRRSVRVAVSLFLWLAGGRQLDAQPVPRPVTLPAGLRVRVTAPDVLPARQTGLIVRHGADSLVLVRDEGTVRIAIPAASITRLEVSAGRPRRRPALIGAGIGFIGGAVVGATWGKREDPNGFGGLLGLIAGAVVGPPVGALIGAAVAPEQWDRTRQPATASREQPATASTGTDASGAPAAPFLALPLGSEVRLHTRLTPQRSHGRVTALSADSLVLLRRDDRVAHAWRNLSQLEVRRGRDRWRGFRRGALIVGAFTAAVAAPDIGEDGFTTGSYVTTVIGNALLGGGVGTLLAPRSWHVLPLR